MLYTCCEPLFAKTPVLEYVTIPKSFEFHMWCALDLCWLYNVQVGCCKMSYMHCLANLVIYRDQVLLQDGYHLWMSMFKPIPSLEFQNTPFVNDVSQIWLSSTTLNLRCYNVIANPHTYIPKIQATKSLPFHLLGHLVGHKEKWKSNEFNGLVNKD